MMEQYCQLDRFVDRADNIYTDVKLYTHGSYLYCQCADTCAVGQEVGPLLMVDDP